MQVVLKRISFRFKSQVTTHIDDSNKSASPTLPTQTKFNTVDYLMHSKQNRTMKTTAQIQQDESSERSAYNPVLNSLFNGSSSMLREARAWCATPSATARNAALWGETREKSFVVEHSHHPPAAAVVIRLNFASRASEVCGRTHSALFKRAITQKIPACSGSAEERRS